jgi:hypothetical protein
MKTAHSASITMRCYESPSLNTDPLDVISTSCTPMTEAEIIAEGKRRTLKANPWFTEQQWNTWLAYAIGNGARIALTPDGARADYDRPRGASNRYPQ